MVFNEFFTEMVLPFLLVFVIVFAILQKSKILGDGKSQMDAMAALAVALLLIGLPQPRDIIVGLMPWMAVGISVIFVFFVLYGFVAGDLSGDGMHKGLKITFGILAGLFTIGVVVYVTGFWKVVGNLFEGAGSSEFVMNAVLIVIIVGVVAFALSTTRGGKDKKDKDED